MTNRIRYTASRRDEGRRLDRVLADHLIKELGLPHSRNGVKRMIEAGAVRVDGRAGRASQKLSAGASVVVDVAADAVESRAARRTRQVELTGDDILFEDDVIIAVNKPADLPTHATRDPRRDHLQAAVVRFLRARDGIDEPYLALHHRLDVQTSGVVVMAKAKAANVGLARSFAEHHARKTYCAITRTRRDLLAKAEAARHDDSLTEIAAWKVENHLGRAPKDRKSAPTRYMAVNAGGDYACTNFRLVDARPEFFLIEARPTTGRTHQIRVHLAEDGLAILGDGLYGDGTNSSGAPRVSRMMLHAWRLEIDHPVTGEPLAIESPLPAVFAELLGTGVPE